MSLGLGSSSPPFGMAIKASWVAMRARSTSSYGAWAMGCSAPARSGLQHHRQRERPHNEALQQTRPAFTTTGAVLAAERRCSADTSAGWCKMRSAR